MPTSLSPARTANEAAEFLPADPDDPETLPCLRLAGALVFGYVTDDGVLEVSVHLDTGDIPSWLLRPDDTVAVHVTVNGDTVAALPTSLSHGRDQHDHRDATLDGDPVTAVTAGALTADLSRHDPRCPVWVQDTLLSTRLVPLRPGVRTTTGPTSTAGQPLPVVVLGVVEDRR
jgi:hypothetical protein